jgi:hypothetical protein
MSHLTYSDIAAYNNLIRSYDNKKGATRSDVIAHSMGFLEEDPNLPRIYIIGDSISIGYTPFLRENLKGIANVLRIPLNGMTSRKGKEHFKEWTDIGHVDLYLINFGIHDIYRDRTVPMDEYLSNIFYIAESLLQKGRVLWVTTTPFIGPQKLHPLADVEAHKDYCSESKSFMLNRNVPICDLDELIASFDKSDYQKDGLHFEDHGSKKIADYMTDIVKEHLMKRKIYV